jgi:hypothetical protein
MAMSCLVVAISFVTVTGISGGPVASANSARSWWKPGSKPIEWQWEISNPLDLSNAYEMGMDAHLADGRRANDPTVYDIDGFDNPASTVAALHARGDKVICYIEVGAAEKYRPDYKTFPRSALGDVMDGYGDERYVNITDPRVVAIIELRIAMCASKGFDAIEPDIDDSYTDTTGFHISEADNIAYDRTLAAYAHSLGLGWGQKNGDNDPAFSRALEPTTDFLLDEQCFQYDSCSIVAAPYQAAHKAIFEVEYNLRTPQFCREAGADDFNSERQSVALNGGRRPCR